MNKTYRIKPWLEGTFVPTYDHFNLYLRMDFYMTQTLTPILSNQIPLTHG